MSDYSGSHCKQCDGEREAAIRADEREKERKAAGERVRKLHCFECLMAATLRVEPAPHRHKVFRNAAVAAARGEGNQ